MISVPKVTLNLGVAPTPVQDAPQQVLLVGQFGTGNGTVTNGQLTTNIGISGEEEGLFGQRSMLATMVRTFRKYNVVTRLDAISLADVGNASLATIVFAGTASKSGTVVIFIQARTDEFKFEIPVNEGDTHTDISSAVTDAINANNIILCTAADSAGDVNLTFKHGGTIGNSNYIEIITLPDDITAAASAFSGGAGDPDLTNIFDVIANIRYQTIVFPGNYDLDVIADLLDSRFNLVNSIKDGKSIIYVTDTLDNFTSGAIYDQDSGNVVVNANELFDTTPERSGGMITQLNVVTDSYSAAVRALRFTPEQNISPYLVGGDFTNTSGGVGRATFPYFNTPLSDIPVIDDGLGWTQEEQEALNAKGISASGNNLTDTGFVWGQMVTLAQTELTFKYLNAGDTASAIREYFVNNNKKRFGSSALTPGDPIPGQSQVSVDIIRGYQVQLYEAIAGVGFGLVPAGTQAIADFKASLVVTISDFQNGIAQLTMIMDIITQLREMNGTILISFPVQGQ